MAYFYLAGRYSRRDEFKALVPLFIERGHHVTSRWLHEDKPLNSQMSDLTPQFCEDTAAIDLRDIDGADFLIFFAEDPLIGTPRGGRHVEFGYALAMHKFLIVIGGAENIFHYLPGVQHFETIEDYLDAIAP